VGAALLCGSCPFCFYLPPRYAVKTTNVHNAAAFILVLNCTAKLQQICRKNKTTRKSIQNLVKLKQTTDFFDKKMKKYRLTGNA